MGGEKRDRDRDKDRSKDREREKDKEKKRDKERDKDRDKLRSRDEHKGEVDKDRGKDRDRRDKDKEKEREKHREDREREKERERRREKEREREKRDRGKLRTRDDDDKDREKKRRRKEEGTNVLDVDPQKLEEEAAEEENKKLDDEMERRRRRVQEWQELRRKKEEDEKAKKGDEAVKEEATKKKGWTLDEDEDEEDVEDEEQAGNEVDAGGDAIMRDSGDKVETKSNHEKEEKEEEEIDPLDAFMNSISIPNMNVEDDTATTTAPSVVPSSSSLLNDNPPSLADVKIQNGIQMPASEKTLKGGKANGTTKVEAKKKLSKFGPMGGWLPGDGSESDGDDELEDDDNEVKGMEEDDSEFVKRVASQTKADKLPAVDHSKIKYAPFRKNFYIEVKEVSRVSDEEVAAYRKEYEFKLRGKDVPKPIKTWFQLGLSNKILDVIKKLGFEKPMPIQAQSLPIIMSGRDCIGIAKTGSGKTLAFVLPMLRHILDQPPLEQGDGPIGMIMAPTRELVQQIYNDIRKFSKPLGLACVPVYGGSGVAQQISELKRGTEIVVCTPGRMIDILCTSAGKITNLRRVTYLVMDEADRMFDMGFEPQIARMVQNTRPDRQTVLFSATFPRQVETLARKVLTRPVEIQVGGRSVVNSDIMQTVEVRPEGEERFLRLLELLGEWYEKGKILVFVHSQEKCDSLFRDLLKHGYPCLSLHGGKDQTDREGTISDFKQNVCNLLIATSVAARGLDVKELELVINYDVPNHYEDYVHRVGRTGRAGRKGYSVTFISAEEERFSPDLVKALELSLQPIPEDLKKMADDFMAKVKAGTEQVHGSGYGGSGFKFNEEEEEKRKELKKAQAKEYGVEEEQDDSGDESESEGIRKVEGTNNNTAALAAQAVSALAAAAAAKNNATGAAGNSQLQAAMAANPQLQAAMAANPQLQAAMMRMVQPQTPAATVAPNPLTGIPGIPGAIPGLTPGLPGTLPGMLPGMFQNMFGGLAATNPAFASMMGMSGMQGMAGMAGMPGVVGASPTPASVPNEAAAKAAAYAATLNLQHNLSKFQQEVTAPHYEAEMEINDFPQHARWKVTHKDALGQINEWTGAAITTRGQYCPPGKQPAPGERKLFLFIEGPTEASVKKAKIEIKRILEETSAVSSSAPNVPQPGKYTVL